MRLALIGDHPDGLAAVRALCATGRHALIAVGDTAPPDFAPSAQKYVDLEELLADPHVEAVAIACGIGKRPEVLRRVLQSERHALCVHPCGEKPDPAYEASLIQGDSKVALVPLLSGALDPSIARTAERIRSSGGPLSLLRMERSAGEDFGWDVLRAIGGEIAEVSGFADADEVVEGQPLLVQGRFEAGGIFQIVLLPVDVPTSPQLRVTVGRPLEEWIVEPDRSWDRWAALVPSMEAAVADPTAAGHPNWQDEIRGLELDDGVHRSIEKRRVSSMEYQEASEEVGFKGTMTLLGCGMFLAILGVLGVSAWVPMARWAVVPLILVFLGLQLFRWVATPKTVASEPTAQPPNRDRA